MKLQKIVRLILCAALIIQSNFTFAFETDQYNLPPAPLADIGAEVTEHTEQNLRKAIDKINAEIIFRQNCLENSRAKPDKPKCESLDEEQAKLAFLRSEAAVARAVYNELGAGVIPFTKSGSWMEAHRFKVRPARYKTGFGESVFAVLPTNYLTVSSTVNLYGANFGTDKIAHFFQQGYDYYKIYNHALDQKSTVAESIKKAVRYGRKTENTFFGTLISGVFSNADLYSNYAGMKFYIGLTREIQIGNRRRPAILRLENGTWKFNENHDLSEILIKPFVSNHLNEAHNPSIFVPGLRSFVRRTVKKRSCVQWRNRFPALAEADFDKISRELKLWNGEDYGFKDSRKFVTIANTCFDGDQKVETE